MSTKLCVRGGSGPRDKSGRCICPACVQFNRERQRKVTAGRKDKIKAWNKANPEKLAGYQKRYLEANPEKRKQVVQSWR